MMLVCGFLGCLGQAFKRSASASSTGADDQPTNHHQQGDRPHNGDRNGQGPRGGRPVSHTGMTGSSPNFAGASALGGPATEAERRLTPGGLRFMPAQALSSNPFDPDLQTGAVASAAAVAAATAPATLVKLDRGSPSRRTPLHVAAERGQLHVLSGIIENLCCSATAALLADGSEDGEGDSNGDGDSLPSGGPSRSGPARGAVGDQGADSPSWGAGAQVGREEGAAGGHHHHHHHPGHRQQPSPAGGGRRSPGPAQQQQQPAQHQGGAGGMVEEFPIARPGAGGAPLAPEQYIQFHLNMQDADGTTALSLACRFGHVDCCRLLLANGSARSLPDARGNTPLHYAALRGHLGVLFMLLDEFVEPGQQEELNGYVDGRNHAGCTPLHYAVWGRQSGSVQVLLQHGADVLPRNSRPAQELTPPVMVVGSTPLHLAAARGHVEICRIILKTFAERVLEPLQLGEDEPQPPTLASLDPRVQVNANGHMPYQVAQRLGFYPLAMLLRPSIPILRLFSDEERAVRFYGPAPLRAIAAEALNKKLLAELDELAAAAAAGTTAAAAGGGSQAQHPSATAVARISAVTPVRLQQAQVAAVGAEAGSGSEGTRRRPVSAPATLEQLAAAAAMDAAADEEEARGGGGGGGGGGLGGQHSGHQEAAGEGAGPVQGSVQAVSTSGVLPHSTPTSQAARPGGASAGGGGGSMAAAAGAGRRVAPPRQLNVEIAVAGGTLDNDGRPSGGARRALVLDAAGAAAAAAGPHLLTPRTPPVGVSAGAPLLSPSAISPRLMSPSSTSSPSPAAGGASPSGLPQPPSRGGSARRTTPPLGSNRSTPLPAGSRSSTAMMMQQPSAAAAPMVAALSRPPSATRANGQSAGESSRGDSLLSLSLPGQPDGGEEVQTGSRGREGAGGNLQAGGGELAAAAAGSVGGAEAGGGELVATDVADALSAMGGGEAEGGAGAGGVYGPRTPVRQPSNGALHVRRMPTSPHGVSSGGATSAPANITNASGGAGARPATSSLATAVSLGSAIPRLDASSSGARHSNDDGRPPGLVRLRSNPLFEDVYEGFGAAAAAAARTAAAAQVAAAGGGGGSGGGGSGATASASGMPPLAEDGEEGEDGPAARSVPAAAPVTPFGAVAAAGGGSGGAGHSQATAAAAADMLYGRPTSSAAVAVAAAAAALASAGDDDEELECGVCMEPLPPVAIAPCRHQICGPCARRICCLNIQKPSHCPFCRATISAFVPAAPRTSTVT